MSSRYFDNSNGIFPGDDVRSWVCRWARSKHRAAAAAGQDHVLGRRQVQGPRRRQRGDSVAQLVTSRAIQLTPAYTGGPTLADGAVIPQDRTAVPVEWDDFRDQLQKLNDSAAAHRAGRGQPAWRVHQHHRRQSARPGRDHPRHHHQTVAGDFGARRPQQRPVLHAEEPVDPGVGAAGQRSTCSRS